MSLTGSTASDSDAELVRRTGLLAQITDVSADAIFSETLDGAITTWNSAAERLYGSSAEEMVGRNAADLFTAETVAQLTAAHGQARSGERVERFDTRHQRPDGRHIAVSVTVSPLRTAAGELAGVATSVQDITERVQLSAEVEDGLRNMEKQCAALARSNRDLEQFAYVASHDLSEPLRVMNGFVQLLGQRYAEVLDERGSRYVAHIVDGSARMRRLIEDLLELARFLDTEKSRTEVDIAQIAHRVAAGYAAGSVDVGDLPPVWCDVASVTAVLQNLVSNGLKFRNPDRSPRVEISASVDSGFVELHVDDNGIGIEPQSRERVFGMFTRLHAREAYPGTGIGLAIVRQIAERVGGRCWVETSHLGGARFCLTLPVSPGTSTATTAGSESVA